LAQFWPVLASVVQTNAQFKGQYGPRILPSWHSIYGFQGCAALWTCLLTPESQSWPWPVSSPVCLF